MRKKGILPMAAVALVVVLGFEKYKSGAVKPGAKSLRIGV